MLHACVRKSIAIFGWRTHACWRVLHSRPKSIFQVKFERCRCFDRGAQNRSHVGWRYRVINIGRIAVADSILISDGSTFIMFCSLSHHLSFSVCICLLHSRRSSRANHARNLAQGGCPDGCWDDYGSVYCDSPDCKGCSECYHDQTGPPGTSGEGTALLIHVCRW